MALTQVRAKLAGTWTDLTYNEATSRWEGQLIPPGTSANQPGGYYAIEVEAANETGQTASMTGEQYAGLRLVVRETAAPTLELVSPPEGYLTTNSPAFVFHAEDEAGGSGIDTASARASIDGVSVPCTADQSGDGYRLSFSGTGLSEGPHTVTVSVSDRDGNDTSVSAAYTVDTVPPAITVIAPDLHRVVDWPEAEVAGYVRDATAGVAAVTVNGMAVELDSSGHFSAVVPLAVGENNIKVSAADKAGLSSSQTYWMLRLVTDRTQGDVDYLAALLQKPWSQWTQEEQTWFTGIIRGGYTTDDFNRVGTAVGYIADYLTQAGYAPGVSPKTNWTEADAPTPDQRRTYLDNVARLKALLPISGPEVPPDMEGFLYNEANDIETILVSADRLFPLMERSPIYSGEAFAGEF